MEILGDLFASNRAWATKVAANDPDFFGRLSRQQAPQYLWIGCSDSRVPANQIVGLQPGELFVHRNVANVVVHADLNCLSVLQYAVDALKVKHVIVCGHYGCGGVQAALTDAKFGMIDNWLRHVQDVEQKHRPHISEVSDPGEKLAMLCELNVIEQAMNVARTTVVRDAWDRGQPLSVHGWVYSLQDGLLRDLGVGLTDPADVEQRYDDAVRSVYAKRGGTAS
jgi:carbonic anhydrase